MPKLLNEHKISGYILIFAFIATSCGQGNEKVTKGNPGAPDSAGSTKQKIISARKSNDTAGSTEAIDTVFENKVMDAVFKLKKIQALNHFIDSASGHKHGVSMMITDRPHDDIDCYYLQAGRDTPERFITAYSFYIYKKGFVIKFNDPVSGEQIDVDKWEEMK